jgi:hypothetical protein
VGKVLYGTFPSGILTAVFLLLSFYLTAGTFLTASGLQFPGRRSDRIVPVNVWTAITFVGFFVALTMSRARVSTAELELVENCKENADVDIAPSIPGSIRSRCSNDTGERPRPRPWGRKHAARVTIICRMFVALSKGGPAQRPTINGAEDGAHCGVRMAPPCGGGVGATASCIRQSHRRLSLPGSLLCRVITCSTVFFRTLDRCLRSVPRVSLAGFRLTVSPFHVGKRSGRVADRRHTCILCRARCGTSERLEVT